MPILNIFLIYKLSTMYRLLLAILFVAIISGCATKKSSEAESKFTDQTESTLILLIAAGDTDAMVEMGNRYVDGYKVEKSLEKATELFQKAAEKGSMLGEYNLGYMYEQGLGISQDYTKSAYWYEKAAKQGQVIAAYNLGNMYFWGKGVKMDYVQGAYWYRIAAEKNYAKAQYNLGLCYANGDGVEKNEKEAIYWYKWASNHDLPPAFYALGVMYEYGRGEDQNDFLAIYYYEKGAELGYPSAVYNMAYFYFSGKKIQHNYPMAYAINKYVQDMDDSTFKYHEYSDLRKKAIKDSSIKLESAILKVISRDQIKMGEKLYVKLKTDEYKTVLNDAYNDAMVLLK